MKYFRFGKITCSLAFALGAIHRCIAQATADGPDFYQVQGAPDGGGLPLRATPGASTPLGFIPVNAECVRNLSCQGGLTMLKLTTLSDKAKTERLAANPRWCKVTYQGLTGWVEGQFLAEAPCANSGNASHQLAIGSKPL
jgi:hypothetical protein